MAFDVIRERLANSLLIGTPARKPVEVVRAMGAVQAQDYPGAKWAIAMRTVAATHDDVEGALDRGEILRTHVLRPTWHFVAPEDIRWMLALTGPRISKTLANYNGRLGLTPSIFRKARTVFEKALRDGAHLTRGELADALRAAKAVDASGTRLAHLVMQAEVEGVVCSGPVRGKQFTYGLIDLRAPAAPEIDRDEALSRLAERYFATHGPATAQDFAWWSGLSVADAKRGIGILGKALVPVDDTTLWRTPRRALPKSPTVSAHLLSNYDEFFIGHRDRSAIGRRLKGVHLVTGGDASVTHVVVVNGELVGSWKRVTAGNGVKAAVRISARITASEREAIDRARKRYEDYASD